MTTKTITIPQKTIPIIDEHGTKVGERNAFLHFLALVVTLAPHRNNTDAFLAHEVGEVVESYADGKWPKTIDMEQSQIDFMMHGLETIRAKGEVRGSGWYYLIEPLNSAVPTKKPPKG